MDYQLLFNIAFSFILFLVGWFVRIAYDAADAMKDAANAMKNDLMALERELHSSFVRREDYKEDIREIKDLLLSIQDRINNKADK
jgi:hypothetical protein